MSLHLVQTLKQYCHDGTRWHFIFPKEPKKRGLCKVIRCRRLARVQVRFRNGQLRTAINSICQTCESRLFRANNPAVEAYRVIKDRAKRRKQVFSITFEEFCAIPRFDEYIARRGRGTDELHLDRKEVHLGYVPGNLQVLTTAENLRKQREVDYAQPF
jgi:hypothetical protein